MALFNVFQSYVSTKEASVNIERLPNDLLSEGSICCTTKVIHIFLQMHRLSIDKYVTNLQQ